MSFSSTTSNERRASTTMTSKLRNLVQPQKVDLKIHLSSRKKVLTTLDSLNGVVAITAPVDTPFEAVEIDFVGTSRTFVERMTSAVAVSGRAEAFHQFLKLSQPGLHEKYPPNRILKAGQTYEFPFVFVVPQQLILRICQHKTQHPTVRDAHLLLPPSFGDKDAASGGEGIDDMAPEMASIRYGVFARVTSSKISDDGSKVGLASKARRVRVMPAVDEAPPLIVGDKVSEYVMRKEKTHKKNVLTGKLGTLVMEAAQPQSLRLRTGSNSDWRTTTTVTVMLRFDPNDDKVQPPKLGTLNSKLRVLTFFASTARRDFPSKQSSLEDLSQGIHSEQLNLSSRCMASVEWKHVDPSKPVCPPSQRRDSCHCGPLLEVGETPAPSSTYQGKHYYTARLLVPITLPTDKAFVPTFHSCLVSRMYQLRLDLGVHTAGISPSMELKLPVQVSAEGSSGAESPLRSPRRGSNDSDDSAIDAEDASSLFAPRTIRTPSEAFVGRSRIGSQAPVDDLPPDYSPFARATSP